MSGRSLHLAAIQPLVIVLRIQDNRHAVVDGTHRRVGFNSDNREALQPVTSRTLPCVPQPGKRTDRLIAQADAERPLVRLAPFIEARDRNQAAALVQRNPPNPTSLEIVRPSIERGTLRIRT